MTRWLPLLPLLAGCLDAPAEPELLPMQVIFDGLPQDTLTLASGVELQLTSAWLEIGDVGLYRDPSAGELSFELIQSAQAHPGHAHAGEIWGEFRGPVLVDLLASATDLGTGTVLQGAMLGAWVGLGPAQDALVLEGVASYEGQQHPFSFVSPMEVVVDDLVFGGAAITPPTLHISLRLEEALGFVDFRQRGAGEVLTEQDGTTAHALQVGLTQPAVWTVTLN